MKKVFQGKIFSVWQWEQELFDGSTATFECVGRPDYACAIGILPDHKILLVEDTQPDREAVITPAGGGVEEGEEPEAAARREFREETGYEAGRMQPWMTFRPHHKVDMHTHIFLARDLQKKGEPTLEAGEKVRMLEYGFDDFLQLGHDIKLRELRLRIILLEALLDSTKRRSLYNLLFNE
jgi:ADP-ribose pyrophosphatase